MNKEEVINLAKTITGILDKKIISTYQDDYVTCIYAKGEWSGCVRINMEREIFDINAEVTESQKEAIYRAIKLVCDDKPKITYRGIKND